MTKEQKKIILLVVIISSIIISLTIYLIILWKDGRFVGGYSETTNIEEFNNLKISSSNIAKYSNTSTEYVDEKVKEKYVQDIESLLLSDEYNNGYNKIYDKLDNDFIQANNLSDKNIEEYLKSNGLVGKKVSVEKMTFYTEGNNTNVYRLKCVIDYNVKYVNIIERSPYNYTLDFGQEIIPSTTYTDRNITIDNIKFEIRVSKKKENAIIYEIKVTNLRDDKVKFDFISINNVALRMSEGGFVKQPSSVLEENTDYSLNKNSYFIKRFYFPVNMQYHKDITGISFYNVGIGNSVENIHLYL